MPKRIRRKTVLENLYDRKLISYEEREAGKRIYQDFFHAHKELSIPSLRDKVDVSRSPFSNVDDHTVLSLTNFRRAITFAGPVLDDVLVKVCCEDCPVRDVEKVYGWVKGAGRLVLQIGLTRLALFYGYQVSDTYQKKLPKLIRSV